MKDIFTINLFNQCQLFFYWRISEGSTGESSVKIWQLANVRRINWRKYIGHLPIDECMKDRLPKVRFAKFLLAKFQLPIILSDIMEIEIFFQKKVSEFEG